MTCRPRLVLTACAAALAALAACGGGGDDSSDDASQSGREAASAPVGGASTTLDIDAGDLFLKPAQSEAPSGTITVNYKNLGSIIHTLKVEGQKGFKLTVPGKGDTDSGEIRLAPGEYVLYCDVPGHRQANMEATLVVK